MDQPTNIRTLFVSAKSARRGLESSSLQPTSSAYQENLHAAIISLEECRRLADRISLFSPNETQDDISSGNLQYMLIDFYLGDMIMKDSSWDRKEVLRRSQKAYEQFLHRLDSYAMLSKADHKLYERFLEARDDFSLIVNNDASARRDTKIKRYKHENELKAKLEYLVTTPQALHEDDSTIRGLFLAELELSAHHAFHALDMMAQELKILALMPTIITPDHQNLDADGRERAGLRADGYSDRLDGSQVLNKAKNGPILDKNGRPLKPFTILNSRQSLRNGVFKADHSLPTMTIDEYLDEEKRRGGMVEGSGEQSGIAPVPDEDDMDKSDMETMKARDWDEFVEANPKGSGNTINRG